MVRVPDMYISYLWMMTPGNLNVILPAVILPELGQELDIGLPELVSGPVHLKPTDRYGAVSDIRRCRHWSVGHPTKPVLALDAHRVVQAVQVACQQQSILV